MTNYVDVTKDISGSLRLLGAQIPETLGAFSNLAKTARKDGALDEKTKELIAMALGVAVRCDGCVGFHAKDLVELGATEQELAEVLGIAVYMGGGPSLMYAANAMKAFKQFSEEKNKQK